MKAVTITCDRCGKDLTSTGAMPAFRLRLTAESLPSTESIRYLVLIYPPIKEDKHFCGLLCLREWINELLPVVVAIQEARDE